MLAKNFNVPEATFDKVPKKELFIFQTALPGPLERSRPGGAGNRRGAEDASTFKPSQMKPTKVTRGGEVKIIDSKIFPVTPISAAIVTLKPGGLRELHWHPNADEWQYYISGKGRMTVFMAGSRRPHHGFRRGRRWIRPAVHSALHRKHGRQGPGISRDVQDAALRGHLAGRVDGAYAAPADGPASASGAGDARCIPKEEMVITPV